VKTQGILHTQKSVIFYPVTCIKYLSRNILYVRNHLFEGYLLHTKIYAQTQICYTQDIYYIYAKENPNYILYIRKRKSSNRTMISEKNVSFMYRIRNRYIMLK
jgi:hypothetical protein